MSPIIHPAPIFHPRPKAPLIQAVHLFTLPNPKQSKKFHSPVLHSSDLPLHPLQRPLTPLIPLL